MNKSISLLLLALLTTAGCNKSPATGKGSAPANPNDPVEKKLQELAGSGATNCGHLKSQETVEMDAAGKCVMQSAQEKKPFYVAYDLPGMTVSLAGNSEGKLFSLQTQPSATGGLNVVPCPAELRIAPSGRATCYAPGTFPMGAGSDSHSGMMKVPAMGENPHKGLGIPPPGQANPHPPKATPPPSKP